MIGLYTLSALRIKPHRRPGRARSMTQTAAPPNWDREPHCLTLCDRDDAGSAPIRVAAASERNGSQYRRPFIHTDIFVRSSTRIRLMPVFDSRMNVTNSATSLIMPPVPTRSVLSCCSLHETLAKQNPEGKPHPVNRLIRETGSTHANQVKPL